MNYNSSFPVRKHEKILRRNPLKTSEISKLLKSNKSLKEKFSFLLMTLKATFQSRSIFCESRRSRATFIENKQARFQRRVTINGGARRDRTADLLRARQALSQLSYGPLACLFFVWRRCSLRSVGHAQYVRSLLHSACALPVKKNPAPACCSLAGAFTNFLS
jgi:hypothetical protein